MVYQMYRLQKERRKMISFVECSMAIQNALMILPPAGKNHLLFREKENRNGSGCLCCFFYVHGRSDE